jgi:hypothetical protein
MYKSKTTRLGVLACAAALLCLGASVGLAGEITGNGKSLKNDDGTLNGRSACAFSGRQDNYEEDEGLFRHMLVQNWGQIFRELRAILTADGLHPGQACNPTRAGGEP